MVFSIAKYYYGIESGITVIPAMLAVSQAVLGLAFACTIISRDRTFGNNPSCNEHARIVFFFHEFPALQSGRALGIALLSIMSPLTVVYFVISLTGSWEELFEDAPKGQSLLMVT